MDYHSMVDLAVGCILHFNPAPPPPHPVSPHHPIPHNTINCLKEFESDAFFSILKIRQRMYGLFGAFATKKFCSF